MVRAARHANPRHIPPISFRRTPVPRRRARRGSAAPWRPLAVLVMVAAAVWGWVDLRPMIERGLGPAATPQIIYGPPGRMAACRSRSEATCVVDGDTIRLRGERIRLSDIDAPEVFSPGCAEEATRGRAATRRLVELLNQGPFDLVQATWRDRDRYGRQLRVAMRDGRSLGDQLIAEGLARPWDGARRGWC